MHTYIAVHFSHERLESLREILPEYKIDGYDCRIEYIVCQLDFLTSRAVCVCVGLECKNVVS